MYKTINPKYKIYIFFTLIALLIIDSFRLISNVGGLSLGYSTYLSILLIYISIFVFYQIKNKTNWKNETPKPIKKLFWLWLTINFISIVRSVYLAKGYWDLKYLFFTAIPFVLISFVFFVGNNIHLFKISFGYFFKLLFPLAFFLIPLSLLTNQELYSRIVISSSFFLLFIPYIKFRYKVLILVVVATSVVLVIGFRTNLIKIGFSFVLLIFFWFKFHKNIFKIINATILITPIVLLVLGISGVFNVFQDVSKSKDLDISTNDRGVTLATDTRTFLYYEVINSVIEDDNILFGGGMTTGYDSIKIVIEEGSDKGKRYASEVGILNIFMQTGIVGVVLYFIFIFYVSNYAINNSNNQLTKLIALFISFRWPLSFVEEFSQYNSNFYIFWLAIGLISSETFRALKDKEIKIFLKR